MRKFLYLTVAIVSVLLSSCKPETEYIFLQKHPRAHVMMCFGFNNLSSSLAEDIRDLEKGFIPGSAPLENYLFVFSHLVESSYSTPSSPKLQRIYLGPDGNPMKETLLEMEPGTISNRAECIREVLEFLKEKYPEIESFGVLMSSHGTGWTPPGYCTTGYKNEGNSDDIEWRRSAFSGTYLSGEYLYEPLPGVKSMGYTVTGVNPTVAYETDIREIADLLPFKLDYIIFDACFMGGVEVAYQFKDKCRYMCFSQTEILSDGMDYTTMISDLLEGNRADLVSLATNYFNHYNLSSGSKRSATISVVDCSKLGTLAAVCRNLFRNYDISKDNVDASKLQKYFYYTNHAWFYDLYSIVQAAGASETELSDLQWALDECILYKAATPTFALYGFPIDTHSGLSMYLPEKERTQLNSYYRELTWNKLTGLLKNE
ncbi:MAG: clostripain-related cysteine peptidase [Candidatus Cryptobacteroides sp.]|nr:clostripain-related cysteine peptidase [Candidatus Cryptobacteroides sp.]